MQNINSSLIHGLALSWAEKKYPDRANNKYLRDQVDVRVYELPGAGYYFIRGSGPGRWYKKSDPTENHFCNCQISEVQSAIDSGGRVQIVGYHGKSLGVWDSWEEFGKEVLQKKSLNSLSP